MQNLKTLGLVLVISSALGGAACAENIQFPTDAGVIDVAAQYGIDLADNPANATDDTTKIQQAIRENINGSTTQILWFKNGVYNINKSLRWRSSSAEPTAGTDGYGGWGRYLVFQGQSRAGTIFKLKNSTFNNPSAPQRDTSVIYTASGDDNGQFDNLTGMGAQGFNNGVYNCTVDTGTGNSAATAIDFLANNKGCIREVTIISRDRQGKAGIMMNREWPGPCLIKNVSIEGFDYGIRVIQPIYGVTIEYLALKKQRVAGIYNGGNVLSLRKITSTENSVSHIESADPLGLITLLDSSFTCVTGSAPKAIVNSGHLFVRNLVTAGGHNGVIWDDGVVVGYPQGSEWKSQPTTKLFPEYSNNSLNLPIEETPTHFDSTLGNWQSVGAPSGGDDSAAIQAAMNSGKSTVYFPNGLFKIATTIHVPATVKHIMGTESTVQRGGGFADAANRVPIFRFEGTGTTPVILDRLNISFSDAAVGTVCVEDATTRPLIIKDSILKSGGIAYRNTNTAGLGKLYIENSLASMKLLYPQSVWARQLNTETGPGADQTIENKGGRVWILGLKTENKQTAIATTNAGETELLGGLIYPSNGSPGSIPAFIDNAAGSSLCYATGSGGNAEFPIHVQETKGGVTRTLSATALPSYTTRGAGSAVTLYSGHS